jgi:hypothetical protein
MRPAVLKKICLTPLYSAKSDCHLRVVQAASKRAINGPDLPPRFAPRPCFTCTRPRCLHPPMQATLGHPSVTTTHRYLHARPQAVPGGFFSRRAAFGFNCGAFSPVSPFVSHVETRIFVDRCAAQLKLTPWAGPLSGADLPNKPKCPPVVQSIRDLPKVGEVKSSGRRTAVC